MKELTEDILAWKKHHQSEIFLPRNKDKSGLDIVCVTGMPLAYNKFIDFFQRRALKRLISKLEAGERKKVLDIGCGTGRWCEFFSKLNADVTGIDISEKRINENKKKFSECNFHVMSATNLDFPKESFDLVNSITVLQHIPFNLKEEAVKEISRVIKKDGYVTLIEGINETDILTETSFLYNAEGWVALFEKNGFKLIFYEKQLGMFLTDKFILFNNKCIKYLKGLLGIRDEVKSNLFDTSEIDRIEYDKKTKEKDKKFLFARKLYRKLRNTILIFFTYLEYPSEYINFYIFKKYNWGTGSFLFQRK